MSRNAPILIIGANGNVGSRIAARLSQNGHPVRPVSRRTAPAFDWEDQSTWTPALAGTEVAFISFFPDLAARGAPDAIRALAETAVAVGVRRVVLLSGRGEHNAQSSEATVQASGLDWTIVRAAWFNQNFSEGVLLDSVLDGRITLPAHDRKEPFVDVEDIADVAAAALVDTRHVGQIYEVTGPRSLTFGQAAAEIAAASGRPVAYEHIGLEAFHAVLLPELGQDYADFLRDLCEEVFDGRNESVGDGVQRALGRQPRDFSTFCREIAASGVWSTK